ncbi:MAG: hypothetical protein HY443_00585 [Candidatus Nealsonbacteria bacterium]|nr:hypothetical protein [Candidatus Nealsonbacteria bacterium]
MPFLDPANFGKLFSSGARAQKAPPAKKEAPKDSTGFGGKSHVTRDELNRWGKRPELFSQTGGISEQDRLKFLNEEFGPEYGPYLEKNKWEAEKIVKKLREKRFQAKTGSEQIQIDKKIKVWNKFLGK